MNRKEIIAAIGKLVGGKTFTFSQDYLEERGGYTPEIGSEERRYSAVTKKYLYISCRVTYGWNADETELGVFFHRYSLYKSFYGENVKRVKLEDLFTKDLEKIYKDIVFALWWEENVHLPRIKKELEECQQYVNMLSKIDVKINENGEIETM